MTVMTEAMIPAAQPVDPRSVADQLGVDDILVFVRDGAGFRLIGGAGRGAGWADIVEIRLGDEPIAERAWRAGVPVRTSEVMAIRVIGPYWARFSVIVPVGDDHFVVFGNRGPLPVSDAILVGAAAHVVAATHHVPAEKLLADELELVHAVRALMSYRPETVIDTARHIALVAARSLSCDVATIHVQHGDGAIETLRLGGPHGFEVDAALSGPDAPMYLTGAAGMAEPLVEQVVATDPRIWTDEVVSRMTLPLGGEERLGALSLGHATARPRGFTMLCQRIGRALAEAAELLLGQAIAREQLAAEHDLLRRMSRTDALTGVGNRAAWDETVRALMEGPDARAGSFAILSADLDQLKLVNDRYGHAIGDVIIRGAADLLHASIRDGDTIARVGGDEFFVLLRDADERAARAVVRRIARNLAYWQITEFRLTPELSVGWAVADSDPIVTAHTADQRMYAAKRRRARRREARALDAPVRAVRSRRRAVEPPRA